MTVEMITRLAIAGVSFLAIVLQLSAGAGGLWSTSVEADSELQVNDPNDTASEDSAGAWHPA